MHKIFKKYNPTCGECGGDQLEKTKDGYRCVDCGEEYDRKHITLEIGGITLEIKEDKPN